jgi:hypothetical protein
MFAVARGLRYKTCLSEKIEMQEDVSIAARAVRLFRLAPATGDFSAHYIYKGWGTKVFQRRQ